MTRDALMIVTEHATASRFLEATVEFRAREPVLTNVIGSVAEGVAAGRTYDSERWLSIHDDDGSIAGIAMRTAPWNLAASPMSTAAAEVLGRHVARADPGLPGITAPHAVVTDILRGFDSPRAARIVMTDVARVLGTFVPPAPVPGVARRATESDRALLVDWHVQFATEAGLPLHDVDGIVAQQVRVGALWLWEVGGEAVAMAGHAVAVPTPAGSVVRIGPVFTPVSLRGRGYGTAVTAGVTQVLMPRHAVLMLFADADNPQSNRIYERLGFAAVATIVETRLAE